jgi:hypothetical protein
MDLWSELAFPWAALPPNATQTRAIDNSMEKRSVTGA